jgi:hypothetical protein
MRNTTSRWPTSRPIMITRPAFAAARRRLRPGRPRRVERERIATAGDRPSARDLERLEEVREVLALQVLKGGRAGSSR